MIACWKATTSSNSNTTRKVTSLVDIARPSHIAVSCRLMTSGGTSFLPCRRSMMDVSSLINACCAACMFDIPCINQSLDCCMLFRCHPCVMAGEYGQANTELIQNLRYFSNQRLHNDACGDC